MDDFKTYMLRNSENVNLSKLTDLIEWIQTEYPEFEIHIKWNQPMFLNKGTFIIGFSLAKNHITVAFEKVVFNEYLNDLKAIYATNKGTYKVQKEEMFDIDLLKRMIDYTVVIKEGYDKFWL